MGQMLRFRDTRDGDASISLYLNCIFIHKECECEIDTTPRGSNRSTGPLTPIIIDVMKQTRKWVFTCITTSLYAYKLIEDFILTDLPCHPETHVWVGNNSGDWIYDGLHVAVANLNMDMDMERGGEGYIKFEIAIIEGATQTAP